MGHYRCPRCGSTDSYVGNVMLAKPSGYISHELGDTGAMGTVPTPGGQRLVQARKCKSCGELLGDSNYEKTAAELAQEQQEKARKAKKLDETVSTAGGLLFLGVICIIVMAFGAILTALLMEGCKRR